MSIMEVICYILSLRGRIMARYRRMIPGLMASMDRVCMPHLQSSVQFPPPQVEQCWFIIWCPRVPSLLSDISFFLTVSVSSFLSTENVFRAGGYWNNSWDNHCSPQKMTISMSLLLQEVLCTYRTPSLLPYISLSNCTSLTEILRPESGV